MWNKTIVGKKSLDVQSKAELARWTRDAVSCCIWCNRPVTNLKAALRKLGGSVKK
jgi:hypothetical protein